MTRAPHELRQIEDFTLKNPDEQDGLAVELYKLGLEDESEYQKTKQIIWNLTRRRLETNPELVPDKTLYNLWVATLKVDLSLKRQEKEEHGETSVNPVDLLRAAVGLPKKEKELAILEAERNFAEEVKKVREEKLDQSMVLSLSKADA